LFQEYRPYFEVLNATSSLLAIITWLVAVPLLIVAWRRSKAIKLSVYGIEATFERGVEAASAITAATLKKSGTVAVSAITRTVESALRAPADQSVLNKTILWVDDDPAAIHYEKQALEVLGLRIAMARDTDEALRHLVRRYDLIITDMGRPSGDRAGYTLLDAIRARGISTPLVIYSSSKAPEHVQEALRRGAQAATNDPRELVQTVIDLLARSH
jgi:CheY-like chemotaxis protein